MTPKEPEFPSEYTTGATETEAAPVEMAPQEPTKAKRDEPDYDIRKPRRVVIRAQIIND